MLVSPEDWKPTLDISLEGTALEVVKSTTSMSVLAGPGAGKTELLAQRAVFLLNTGLCPPPKRILAITFKVDAARNLQDRVLQRSEPEAKKRFESLTLHTFAKRTLDQFREALEPSLRPSPNYKIIFPYKQNWITFQEKYGTKHPEVYAFNTEQLKKVAEGLPDFDAPSPNQSEIVRRLWWSECINSTPSEITFEMIFELAMHIVHIQPIVKDAIASTYTHVFLDEFQDVSGQQYALVSEIFKKSPTVITAVGDTNQAIMGWAGALPDIFNRFGDDFLAINRKLLLNFRSSSRIVELINDLAKLFIDADPVRTESARRDAGFLEDAVESWIFPTSNSEGKGLAHFVKESLAKEPSLAAHDFVILARLRVDVIEKRLAPHFAAQGIRLRNEARSLGPISIQDLVKEPIFLFLTAIFKMAHGIRQGSPFQVCRDILANLEGIDLATDRGAARSLQLVQMLVAAATAMTRDKSPAETNFAQLTQIAFPNERREQLRRTYRDYLNREYLDSIIDVSATFFTECCVGAATWNEFIDNVEGRGAVKLMTIHKSKGLEYHTVIFMDINDESFWNNNDDANVFFVALSRARERIRFSLRQDVKGHNNVNKFLRILEESGVVFKNFN